MARFWRPPPGGARGQLPPPRYATDPFQLLSLKMFFSFPKIFEIFFSKLKKKKNFPKMTPAIIHNDTNISLLVTDNYNDDCMIAHKHAFMCNN